MPASWEVKVDGKVVVITGASSGIGEGIARLLAGHGAKVVLGARRGDRLERIVAEIRESGGVALAQAVDVTVHEQVKALVAAAVDRFGRIDVMINNAGFMPIAPLDADQVADWDRCIDINIKGVMYGISAALPHFRAQGGGHLINVSSVGGHKVLGGATVYCGTKYAVRAITEGFRQEVGPTIRSTNISPGAIQSELSDHITDPTIRESLDQFKGIELPAEAIAQAVLYAIQQPAAVDINEMIVRPTAQTF